MIRMSKMADYSFVILTKMVDGKKDMWSAAALSASTELPLPTVAKLMKIMARKGFVTAQRGVAGGYRLAATPEKISVAAVVEAIDGPIALVECAGVTGKESGCLSRGTCSMKSGLMTLNAAVRKALESVTLSEIVSPPQTERISAKCPRERA